MIWSKQRYTDTHRNTSRQLHVDKNKGWNLDADAHAQHQMNKWVGTGHGGILKAVKGDALGLQISAH